MYERIQAYGVADNLWHWEEIQVVPFPLIESFLVQLDKKERHQQNISQYAIAQYAAAKFSSPADPKKGKPEKIYDYKKLLPWPTDGEPINTDTIRILQELVDAGELLPKAHAAALKRLNE